MIRLVVMPSSIAIRVRSGRQSIAIRNSCAGRRRVLTWRSPSRLGCGPCSCLLAASSMYGLDLAPATVRVPLGGSFHAPRAQRGLLGTGTVERGPARACDRGGVARLRLSLDRGGLRL